MINDTLPPHAHHECHWHPFKRISWTAVLAGAFVGIGLGFLLNLFQLAINLNVFTMTSAGARTIAIGGLLGLIIATVVSSGVAGMTAGYLGRTSVFDRHLGVLHGFLAWTFSLLIGAIIAGHVAGYVVGFTNNITHATVAATQNNHAMMSRNIMNASSTWANTPANENANAAGNNGNGGNNTMINNPADTGSFAISTFIIFALFFIGALSACVGGSYGMHCCHHHKDDETMPRA